MLSTAPTKTPTYNCHKESNIARISGSVIAGVLELALFHPIDTVSKRLMSNQGRITSLTHLNKVIFKENTLSPLSLKFVSLFPGLEYAAGYKILQRVYKYSGQPIVILLDIVRRWLSEIFCLDHRLFVKSLWRVISESFWQRKC